MDCEVENCIFGSVLGVWVAIQVIVEAYAVQYIAYIAVLVVFLAILAYFVADGFATELKMTARFSRKHILSLGFSLLMVAALYGWGLMLQIDRAQMDRLLPKLWVLLVIVVAWVAVVEFRHWRWEQTHASNGGGS